MTTVLDIVTRAFRKLDVGGVGEELTAGQVAEGLGVLNDMLHGWAVQGIALEGVADLALADEWPFERAYVEGTVYLLASRLGPNYQVPPGFDADAFLRALQAATMTVDEATIPTGLRRMTSTRASRRWI